MRRMCSFSLKSFHIEDIKWISTRYQLDVRNAAGFKMALRHFCVFLFVSVCFYMFLSASVSFYILLLFLYVFLFTGGSLFLLL